MMWKISNSGDPKALAVVDGLGRFSKFGPHYSRRSPGSKTFTGVGRELVLLSECGSAVWAVVHQRIPHPPHSGSSRKGHVRIIKNRYVWRNMLFRNLGTELSSDLIREASRLTYSIWPEKYGSLPGECLRTEVNSKAVKSTNPGYCYICAGWLRGERKRNMLFLYAPENEILWDLGCDLGGPK